MDHSGYQAETHGSIVRTGGANGVQGMYRKPGSNARACQACRSMKMKCEGAANPPCLRCRKAKRICNSPIARPEQVFSPPVLIQDVVQGEIVDQEMRDPKDQIRPFNFPPEATQNYSDSEPRAPSETFTASLIGSIHPLASSVPYPNHSLPTPPPNTSIYSLSPAEAINQLDHGTGAPSIPRFISLDSSGKRQQVDSTDQSFETQTKQVEDQGNRLDQWKMKVEDMRELIQMFRENIIPYIPALRAADFHNTEQLIQKELPVAHTICYVMANYIPGGKELRKILRPIITDILTGRYNSRRNNTKNDELIEIKASIILYAYADAPASSNAPYLSDHENMTLWSLKSICEANALRSSLHRSLKALQSDLASALQDITTTTAFQRYIYWLWLYTMAQYCSIVTATPPTIRADSTIRAAPMLMQKITGDPHFAGVVGKVELCLIWEKVSSQHEKMGEWWCLPDDSENVDDDLTESLFEEAERELDIWYDRWGDYIRNIENYGARLEYHGRFTRFCVAVYVTRSLNNCTQALTAAQRDRLKRCFSCATHLLDWLLNLSPVQKAKLRYITDFGAVIVVFCCLFVLSACQKFSPIILDTVTSLNTVEKAGQLIKDLGQDAEHTMYRYGSMILKRVDAARTMQEYWTTRDANGLDSEGSMGTNTLAGIMSPGFGLGAPDFSVNLDDLFGTGQLWDFSHLFPNP